MKTRWFENSVIYQIYPRSFCDSNGDGIGDIKGIISKLDHLCELGIDCVWLSPCYASPNDDNGYDISDYYSINPEFGTLADWKKMLEEMHKRNIKLVMDLVVNHTSSEHEWFVESKKSKDNPYRDYYFWKKGKKDNKLPPNNWNSCFTGKAWSYDETTEEYYLHLFTKKQVDLNWENPKVKQEVLNVLDFWFDLGVDGFRCDVINYISKPKDLPDDKSLLTPLKGAKYFTNGPKIHEHLKFLNENSFSKRDSLFLGECPGVTVEEAKRFTAKENHEMDMVFQFEHVESGTLFKYIPLKFKLKKLKKIISKWQIGLMHDGWNSLYLENHDQARSISRFGSEEFRNESGKLLGTMLFTLKGTPFIYQGQELGMVNAKFENLSDYLDTASQSVAKLLKKIGFSEKRIVKFYQKTARDQARTPMQWNGDDNGGFTSGTPWMKINPNYKTINAEIEKNDDNSIYNYYKKLIALRKAHKTLVYGEFKELLKESNQVFAYERNLNDEKIVVLLNFSEKEIHGIKPAGEILIANYNEKSAILRPYEAIVVKV